MAKLTEQEIALICTNHGHVYVKGYINSRENFNCICSCGQPWSIRLSRMRQGIKCRSCSGFKLRTSNDVADELTEYGVKLLQPYINGNIPVIYECSCGGIGKTTLGNIRAGNRCGHCVEMRWRNFFLDHNCEIVTYNSTRDITYVCSCGKLYHTRVDHFKDGSKQCPSCRVHWNYNPDAVRSRINLYYWKKEILQRDLFECKLCTESLQLEVHHIEAYSVRPDLADCVDNGITLCFSCHRGLHSRYGINVGRENLRRQD